MQIEKKAFLLTGSNIEPRAKYLALAANAIEEQVGRIIDRSSIYESKPWGFEADMAFLNQVLVVETKHAPAEILKKIHSIEIHFGRTREGMVYISRTIDIDILYFENEIIDTAELVIPHPRLHERRFTLLPLVDVAGDFIHPVLKETNNELLNKLIDQDPVWEIDVNKSWENV